MSPFDNGTLEVIEVDDGHAKDDRSWMRRQG